ncbi:MAG TPA: pilus assembly protein TadG-related protein [Gemmataceae bacterium]|nr:pilus assembly protein TadG-related protein [Gemmataceae bacterium]
MARPRSSRRTRSGAIAPLTALLLIPLCGFLVLTIDLSHLVWAQTELQSAADSAALAGADQLMNGWVQYYLPGQTLQSSILSTGEANAKTYAKNWVAKNSAGGVSNLTLLDSDIEFGYTDSSRNYTACPTYTGYPNTIKVTVRRDSTANTPVTLFFGSLLGHSTSNLSATAAATIYTGSVNSFQQNSAGRSVGILPMTYDINHWNNFLATGQGPDGSTDTAANGAPQLQVYPSIKYDGNFGELSLDQGNDGASTISGWISNGVSWSDLQNEFNANLLPLSANPPNTWDWKGNPGLKTSTIHTADTVVGQQFLLPLFQAYDSSQSNYQAGTGNGSHYYYDIVAFVGITITQADDHAIHVQPSAYIDPSVVFTSGSITPATPPASGSSSLGTVFTSPKLTK